MFKCIILLSCFVVYHLATSALAEKDFLDRQLKSNNNKASCQAKFSRACGSACTGHTTAWNKYKCQVGCFKSNPTSLTACPMPALSMKIAQTANCSDVVATTCSDCEGESGTAAIDCYANCAKGESNPLSHCQHEQNEIPGQPSGMESNCTDAIMTACPDCFSPTSTFASKLNCLSTCLGGQDLEDCNHFQQVANCTGPFNVTTCSCDPSLTGLALVKCELDCMQNQGDGQGDHRDGNNQGDNTPAPFLDGNCQFPGIANLTGWSNVTAVCAQMVIQNCGTACATRGHSLSDQADCWSSCIDDQRSCNSHHRLLRQ